MERLSASQKIQLQKGLSLRQSFVDAVTIDLVHRGEYRVRSETGNGFYRVVKATGGWACECPAFEELGALCKHIWAVRAGQVGRQAAESAAGGSLKTYSQDWPAYNAAGQNEYLLFDPLLWSLLDEIPEPARPPGKRGRNPIPLRTQLLVAIKKVHLGKSCLRSRGLIRSQFASGNTILPKVPNYAVPSRVFNRPESEGILVNLIRRSALPLKDLEGGGTVAIDSSGFCTTVRGIYCTQTHNPTRKQRFAKAHLAVGTKTHVILNVKVTEEIGADTTQFGPLLRGVKEAGFDPRVVVADRAYPSRQNYATAAELGMEAYLPFRSNATGAKMKGHTKEGQLGTEIYRKMLHMFQLHREEFDQPYHARSNVEAVFSAIKRKLGEGLLSKNGQARFNELLAKLLAYNLTVLIHEIYEHGIDPESIGLPPPAPRRSLEPDSKPVPEPSPASPPDGVSLEGSATCDYIPAAVTEFDGAGQTPS